jgi:hypothetical protein
MGDCKGIPARLGQFLDVVLVPHGLLVAVEGTGARVTESKERAARQQQRPPARCRHEKGARG